MVRGKIDDLNVVPLMLLPAASGVELKVLQFTSGVNSIFDFSFTYPIWSGAGSELTIAMLIYLVSGVAIFAQGQISPDKYEREELAAMVTPLLLVPLYQFPAFGALVDGTPIVAVAIWLSVSVSAFAASRRA